MEGLRWRRRPQLREEPKRPRGDGDRKRRYLRQAETQRARYGRLSSFPGPHQLFAGAATPPHQVALALEMSPTSSAWGRLTGAAGAYGLTKGGINASKIAITELGRRATAPTEEGDDLKARAEAALRPGVCKAFFEKYTGEAPPDHIALNVLRRHFRSDRPRQRLLEILKDTVRCRIHSLTRKTGPFVAWRLAAMPVATSSGPFEVLAEVLEDTQVSLARNRGSRPELRPDRHRADIKVF